MALIFRNEMHDEFGSWPLAYIPYGGADFGEILAVARATGDGDDGAFHQAWMAAGDRIASEARGAQDKGLIANASELFLRASCFYATSYHPLYGEPVDPRLVMAFAKQTEALDNGLALRDPRATKLSIPFEGTHLPGYFIPALGHGNEVRPVIILTNGYDASMTDLLFASAVAASRRGYHCVIFDGPGQGAMLIEQGVRLRHDWETVVKAVVDVAVTLPLVDPARIALSGWSLGGYLAPRAASGEHRLAACIADPGQRSMLDGFRGFAQKFGATITPGVSLGDIDQATLDGMWQAIERTPKLHWSFVQRGFWVHGVDNLRDYLRAAEQFTLADRIGEIRCPTLLTLAENDSLTAGTQAFYDALRCPKELVRFTADEGAGDHCEMGNRSLLNRRVLDWLDGVMAK